MENKATWNEVEKAIEEAIREHEAMVSIAYIVGPSLPRRIYQKLRNKGFLRENKG